ncbi:MAG: hypothetical protein HDR30_10555 [Lachnospiraceae bacterium]|nr:hypothetical protein [Lachnospiraceae bacterium]
MKDKKVLHCENCHAIIPADSAKCPYCGALNAVGGEKQYMEHLFDLKEDVEELKDVPLQTYKQELKRSSRIIKRTLFICCIVGILAVGVFFITDKFRYAEMPVAEQKEQLLWEKENFPKLDALYADGDYEGILEFENTNCADGYYSLYNWEHYGFISLYRWYLFCEESAAQAQKKNYDNESVERCILDAMYVLQEKNYVEYDDEDQVLVDNCKAEVREMLRSQFDMQDEDFAALYAQCCKEDEYGTYFNYKLAEKKVKAYVKNNMENGKVVR